MESRNVKAMDIGKGFWIDIDDERALERAENLLAARG
jgi:hypothetical protein